MQIRGSVHKSVVQCAKTLYKTEGFQAFYISYPTTLMMSIPLSAVQFSVYEAMKTFLNPTGEYSPSTHVMAGGVAGATAAAVTTPLDVAKVSINASGSRPR
jgi:solute carrier family 25 iron transporter 28/37